MSQSHPDPSKHVVASALLQQLFDSAPADNFTVNGLMDHIPNQSFALMLLLLDIGSFVPGIGVVATLLLMICAFEMIIGCPAPVFPRWIGERPLPTKHLAKVVTAAVKGLKLLESAIRPRLRTPPGATKRMMGIVVLLVSIRLLLSTLPLSNFLPAFVIASVALGYLEEDGFLLALAFVIGIANIALDAAIAWEIVR